MKTPSYLTALPLAFPLLASGYPSYPLKRGANGTAMDSVSANSPPLLLRTTNVRFVEQPEGND